MVRSQNRSEKNDATDKLPPALSVVIPAYNEARRLGATLSRTIAYLEGRRMAYELLVVDDGSADATSTAAAEWACAHTFPSGSMRVLRYEPNRGKGYAVRHGILRAKGEMILFMDADLATPIEEMEKLEAALNAESNAAQIAIGSRPLPSSQLLIRQPWYRELSGRAFNQVVQFAATPGIHDTQCGFKLMTRKAALNVFSRCTLDGFSFDVEMLLIARRLGYGIAEVPVRWAHQEGAAAFSTTGAYLRHGLRMVGDLAHIRWTHRSLQPIHRNSVSIASCVRTPHA